MIWNGVSGRNAGSLPLMLKLATALAMSVSEKPCGSASGGMTLPLLRPAPPSAVDVIVVGAIDRQNVMADRISIENVLRSLIGGLLRGVTLEPRARATGSRNPGAVGA